jgi:hypothetical protein
MSAITLFPIANYLVARDSCDRVRTIPQDVIQHSRVPVVSPRWTVEIDQYGNRRLVERWSKNRPDSSPKESMRSHR